MSVVGSPTGVDESLLQDKASKLMTNQNQAVVFGVLTNTLLFQLTQKTFASVGIFISRSEALNVQPVLEVVGSKRSTSHGRSAVISLC